MKVLFSPQVRDTDRIYYEFKEGLIKVWFGNKTDTFDFRNLPDGELEVYDSETGEEMIETELDIQPIISAKKENGILYVKLLNFIGLEATKEECFPDWIDHEEYKTIEIGSEKDSDELKDWDDF